MSKAAIQTSPNQPPAALSAPGPGPARPARRGGPLVNALKGLASLRLTVVLFVLCMLLVFFGTMAQMDEGIWTVLHKYFRSVVAWVPLQVLVRFGQVFFGLPSSARLGGSFPFPGGYVLGGLLLVNLLAAHLVRFRVTWKRSGILLIHSGLVVMMLGELVTGLFAAEGRMTIPNGESANYTEDYHAAELAVVDPSNPKTDDVVVIPSWMLQKGGLIQDPLLPFDVKVDRYMVNSAEPSDTSPGALNRATAGAGLRVVAVEQPEVSGTDPNHQDNAPSAYVTFEEKPSKGKVESPLGTYLVSVHLKPQEVKVGGKTYEVALRFQRGYKPYTLHLLKFTHDVYPGTDIPKDYSSRVRLVDPERGEDREVLIYMNNPLRYRGETFYQSSFLEGDRGTVLQVVRNPGWLMPYFSCVMVAAGMLVHFGIHLSTFIRRRVTL